MLRRFLQTIISKAKGRPFRFDRAVTGSMVATLVCDLLTARLRGFAATIVRGRPCLGLYLGRGVKFRHFDNIILGESVRIGDCVYLSALGSGTLELGGHVSIGDFSRLVISTSFNNIGRHIRLGNHVAVGEFAYLGGGGGLSIGEGTIIGQYFSAHPENHIHADLDTPIRLQGVDRKGISVGMNCWIGAKVTLLDGCGVGDNSVVAAGAVVTKVFPPNVILGGVPAKIIRQR